MVKCYVKIDGVWVKVYETYSWYDIVCWVCAFVMVGCVGFLLWKNVL